MTMEGELFGDDGVLNAIHVHVASETFHLEGDIKVAIVQENVQCASTAVLITVQPSKVPAVGTDPHPCGNDCDHCGQNCEIRVRTDHGHSRLLSSLNDLGGCHQG